MRAPLDKIELVEKYLTGKLAASEQLNFIKALETDVELQQLVNLQKDIIKAVQRKALKAEIKTTIKHINIWKRVWKWIIGGGVVLAVLTTILISHNYYLQNTTFATSSETATSIEQKQALNEEKTGAAISDSMTSTDERIDFNGLKMWMTPDVQTFKVDPSSGATIEGKEGTLIIVPSNAFVDKNNRTVTGEVEVRIVEALTLADMVLYNLGTTANGKPLETGGMLHFDYTCDGEKVTVDPKRPLYVMVPTIKVKEGMVVFKGEVQGGKINWKNPQPLKKYLVNVNLQQLDFLPLGFADTVKAARPLLNYKVLTSELVNDLYEESKYGKKAIVRNKRVYIRSTIFAAQSYLGDRDNDTIDEPFGCGINPASIAELKDPHLAKTFVATREFAERVKQLHRLQEGEELLEFYLKNLNKNLSELDAAVADRLTGENKEIFRSFAEQGLTNLGDGEMYRSQLVAYYSKKIREYERSLTSIQKRLNKKIGWI